MWEEEGLVKYMGPTKDVPSFIAKADCIVLPSYREGISKILLESASMAKPIIATNVPGCRDIVEHTVSGYLCRVKDAEDLAVKMYKMMNLSSDELQKMGENGRAFVCKHFDEKIVIANYIKVMDSYCKTPNNRKYKLKS
jgi:glycosyltransferase involved in cell wall biosynthesis